MLSKIKLKKSCECDVFVIGAGIAGVMAAIQASQRGAAVIIASSANILSGSSFYPGTWGLGLIGPENKEDEKDLARTIKEVGCDVVDENLVQTFVSNIPKGIQLIVLIIKQGIGMEYCLIVQKKYLVINLTEKI